MKLSFDIIDSHSNTDYKYIGDYESDYKKARLFVKSSDIKETLEFRHKVETGEIIYLKKGSTKLENFLIQETDDFSNFLLLTKSINSKVYKIRYVESDIFKKIKNIIKEDYPQFENYVNDLALIVSIAKARCFFNDKYLNRFDNFIPLADINNFFADIAEKKGVKINDIVIHYSTEERNKKETLKITELHLIKMMLYEFARKYYKTINRADEEHWEIQIPDYRKKKKRGNQGYNYSKYLTALICLYWEFCKEEKLFQDKAVNSHKYHLLGKILSLADLSRYNEKMQDKEGYTSEADFYYKTLSEYWKPKETKS